MTDKENYNRILTLVENLILERDAGPEDANDIADFIELMNLAYDANEKISVDIPGAKSWGKNFFKKLAVILTKLSQGTGSGDSEGEEEGEGGEGEGEGDIAESLRLLEATMGDELMSDEELDALIAKHSDLPPAPPEDNETEGDVESGDAGSEGESNPEAPSAPPPPETPPEVDYDQIDRSYSAIAQIRPIMQRAYEIAERLAETDQLKSLPDQLQYYIKFLNKQEAKLDAYADEVTNPFSENMETLRGLGFTDNQIQDLIIEELDAILLDEGMRDEFIKSLKGSAIALGLASCIGAGCDVSPEVQSQVDHEESAIVLHINNKLGSDVQLELNGVPIGDFIVGECDLQDNQQCSSTFEGESSYGESPDGETQRCGMTRGGPEGFTDCDDTVRTILVQPGEYRLTVRGPGHLEPLTKDWGGSRKRGENEKLTEKTIDLSQGLGTDNARELVIHYDFEEFPSMPSGYQAVIKADIVE